MTRGWTIPACHDFYPRPPRGGRLVLPDGWEVAPYFYPRPPRGGRQGKKWSDKEVIKISIHALREEGDQRNLCTGQHSRYFYPRPPRGGRRAEESVVFGVKAISIHALREEGDVPPRASFSSSFYFYPRPPRGGRLNPPTQEEKAHQFLSTPSARRATTRTTYADRAQMISIHALREEGDNIGSLSPGPTQNFYPRPPRGGRPHSSTVRLSGGAFLSTPSARRATVPARFWHQFQENFYPRPPRGGRRSALASGRGTAYFYPRPPRGGRRSIVDAKAVSEKISIHALREEGDHEKPEHRRHQAISIHALREEGDHRPSVRRQPLANFYPRPPRGGRLAGCFVCCLSAEISIHALREEGDYSFAICLSSFAYFYPRPPRGGRPPLPAERARIQ